MLQSKISIGAPVGTGYTSIFSTGRAFAALDEAGLITTWGDAGRGGSGAPTDWNVYDAASWSDIFELSQRSVANKSHPVDFPHFTRGRWKTNPPLGIVTA